MHNPIRGPSRLRVGCFASGMTLLELVVGVALLVVGIGGLLMGMPSLLFQVDYFSHAQAALNAAQGQLDQLSATPLDTLWTGPAYAGARGNGQSAPLTGLPAGAQGVLTIQIKSGDLHNPGNPSLLDLHVAACWRERGRQIGGDRNCNGQFDVGEQVDADGWLQSPVMVSTRMGRRDS
ncbi:MAG: hypothetical protein HY737_04250 [Candidatus Omnitrophica bacterium]|nr:hypothetical protein [Candidatus Omnitrophota bacterium]